MKRKKERKSKGVFGKIYRDEKNDRFKCNYIICDKQGNVVRKTVTGSKKGSKEEIERRLYHCINANVHYDLLCDWDSLSLWNYETAIKELSNLKTVIESEQIIDEIDMSIAGITERMELWKATKAKILSLYQNV